ncbi:MAG TPA: hypothetical protein VGB42_12310 [Candidatus Thermoplasmatota archaeon]
MRTRIPTLVAIALTLTATPLLPVAGPAAAAGDGDWSPPVVVGRLASDPSFSVSPDGTAVAAWVDVPSREVIAARFLPGVGWMAPEPLQANGSYPGFESHVGTDATGNAVAVWVESDGGSETLWSRRLVSGVGWTPPTLVAFQDGASIFAPRLAVGSGGAAACVWIQFGADLELWGAPLDPAAGWGAPAFILNGSIGAHTVAVGPSGEAVVLASLSDGTRFALHDTWLFPGAPGWTAPAPMENGTASVATPHVAFDARGNAVSLWDWSEGATLGVSAAQFSRATGWGPSVDLRDAASALAYGGRLAVSPGGEATAAWTGLGGTGGDGAWASRLTPGAGWSAPAMLLPTAPGYPVGAGGVVAGRDGAADVLLVERAENSSSLYGSHYDAVSGWAKAATVAVAPVDAIGAAWLGGDARGDALALWSDFAGGSYELRSSLRREVDRTAPAITVIEPLDGSALNATSAWVRVSTEPGALVEVNGVRASHGGNGTYAALVPLQPGPFRLDIVVADVHGNVATEAVDLSVGDVIRDLTEQTAAEMERLQAALDRLYNESFLNTATREELTATRAILNDTQEQLANGTHELGHALGNLASAVQEVANLSAKLNATQAALDEALADVGALETAQSSTESEVASAHAQAVEASSQAGMWGAVALVGLIIGGGGAAFALSMGRSVRELEDCCEKWRREHGGGPSGPERPSGGPPGKGAAGKPSGGGAPSGSSAAGPGQVGGAQPGATGGGPPVKGGAPPGGPGPAGGPSGPAHPGGGPKPGAKAAGTSAAGAGPAAPRPGAPTGPGTPGRPAAEPGASGFPGGMPVGTGPVLPGTAPGASAPAPPGGTGHPAGSGPSVGAGIREGADAVGKGAAGGTPSVGEQVAKGAKDAASGVAPKKAPPPPP